MVREHTTTAISKPHGGTTKRIRPIVDRRKKAWKRVFKGIACTDRNLTQFA